MKAAIITLQSVCNYGTQLQAYATQEKLKEYFAEVQFIDYRRYDTYGIGLLNTYIKGNPLKIPIILPTLIYWNKIFGKFRKKYLNIKGKKYLSDKDFENFEDVADIYFSGSDQVWNTGWNKGVIPAMYLSFVPNDKPRYAYSSSFGLSRLDECYVEEVKKYLKMYKRISVREDTALEILKDQLDIQTGTRIIDPTLLMPIEFWKNLKPQKKIKDEDYILIYNLNRSKEFDNYAKKLAQKTGCKLYRFCTRFDQIFRTGKSVLIPDVFDFITLVDSAKYVLTDSFHATAFSINLNTEPICIYPEKYSSRLSSFLELVDATDRHVKDYNDFSILDKHTDFDNVNKILDKERKKADDYLKLIVKENEEKYGKM